MQITGVLLFIVVLFEPISGMILRGKREATLQLINSLRQNAQKEVNADKLDTESKMGRENLFEEVMSNLSEFNRQTG
jgi:hypothetical protein